MARGRASRRIGEVGKSARAAASKAGHALRNFDGPSPNPMTNLILADIALRGTTRVARLGVERLLLGAQYDPEAAERLVRSRSLAQTLVGTALARMATRSVPGALLVGGTMLAKTLYDRSRDRHEARQEGEEDVAEQVRRA